MWQPGLVLSTDDRFGCCSCLCQSLMRRSTDTRRSFQCFQIPTPTLVQAASLPRELLQTCVCGRHCTSCRIGQPGHRHALPKPGQPQEQGQAWEARAHPVDRVAARMEEHSFTFVCSNLQGQERSHPKSAKHRKVKRSLLCSAQPDV